MQASFSIPAVGFATVTRYPGSHAQSVDGTARISALPLSHATPYLSGRSSTRERCDFRRTGERPACPCRRGGGSS